MNDVANTMKAWAMTQPGPADVLQPVRLALPEPGPGQVRIRVVGSGFNPLDAKIRAGLAAIPTSTGVPGCDVSGVIDAIGPDVHVWQPGDRVFACAGGVKGCDGSLAEYMLADPALLAPAPETLELVQAAALPLVSITAWEALNRLDLKPGDRLLILGGSGGVGQMAVQLADLRGAHVTATAGTEARQALVRSLGADETCLHADVTSQPATFNKVLDTFGGVSLETGLQMASPYAQVATINARNTYDLTQAHAKALTLHAVFMALPLLTGQGRDEHGLFLKWLSGQIDAGQLQAPEVEVFHPERVADVHRRYEAGELRGKAVFRVAD